MHNGSIGLDGLGRLPSLFAGFLQAFDGALQVAIVVRIASLVSHLRWIEGAINDAELLRSLCV